MSNLSTEKTYTIFFAIEGITELFSNSEKAWNIGGAEIQMYYLASTLSQMPNCKVIFLTEKEIPAEDFSPIEIRKPVKAIKRGLPFISRKINRARKIAAFGYDTDVAFLIATNNESFWMLNEARENGIPVILRINGDSLVDGRGLITERTQTFIDAYISHSDGIVVQSHYQQQAMRNRYNQNSKIIGSCYSTSPQTCSAQISKPIPHSALWIGRIDAVKRPWMIATLAQMLPHITFIAVVHDRHQSVYTAQFLYDLKKLPNVHLYESLSPREIAELYHCASIVINTSSTEGIPNTLIEAAMHRKPFLALEVDPAEVLSSEMCGLTAHGDLPLFISQINHLMQDASSIKAIGDCAYDFALSNWSSETSARKYLDYGKQLYLEKNFNS